jgi:hypothetical protein
VAASFVNHAAVVSPAAAYADPRTLITSDLQVVMMVDHGKSRVPEGHGVSLAVGRCLGQETHVS